jgi:hypothetical protein
MKNKKYILIALAVLMLALPVSALDGGEIFTQTQINNANFDTFNLQCSYHGVSFDYISLKADFAFSCLSIQQSGKNYIVYRQSILSSYFLADYISCRLGNSKATCLSSIRDSVLDSYKISVSNLRTKLKSYQTTTDLTASDFTFTIGELNP